MKIGIDIRTLMDERYSGVSNYTLELVNGLLRQDTDNQYKLFYNSGEDLSDRMPRFDHTNVEIIATHYPNKVFNYLLQKMLKKPKIDQLLNVDLFFMPHINFAALSGSCQKIITIHDLSFLKYKHFFSWRKNAWHRLINIKKLLNQFDTVVAVSENTKRDIVNLLKIPADKIKVIYSGLGGQYKAEVSENIKTEVREKYDLPDNFLLYLGNLEPRKNIESIILAFDSLLKRYPRYSNYSLVIAGRAGWSYDSIYHVFAKSANQEKIKIIGYADEKDKVVLYKLASVFLFPSLYEGFGFPVIEAMACGTPVITSANSSLPEVGQDGVIYINPYNFNEIAEAINQVLHNENLHTQLLAKSQLIINQFSWQKSAEEYLRLFSLIH